MQKTNPYLIVLSLLVACSPAAEKQGGAPVAQKIPTELTAHGHTRVDNYYWMKEREDPDVIAYLNAENDYLKQVTASQEGFKKKLFDEMKGRIMEDDSSVPYLKEGYYYASRFGKGAEYPVYTRKKDEADAVEEVLVDANERGKGRGYYAASGLSVSPDQQILAFAEDTIGRRNYNLLFRNLTTGQFLPDVITGASPTIIWAKDNKTVFYTRRDPVTLREYRVYKHRLGEPAANDELIYEETDNTFALYLSKTKSQEYIMMVSNHQVWTEYRIIDADTPDEEFKVFLPRKKGHEYYVDHVGDYFYIRSNADSAANYKLMRTPVTSTAMESWEEVVPHRSDVLLEDVSLFKDFLVLGEMSKGLTQVNVRSWDGKSNYYVPFDEPAYTAYLSENFDFNTSKLRFKYSSLTTPLSTYDLDMSTNDKELLKRTEVLGDFDPANYVSERLYAKARDGVEVPVSLVYRKGLKKDGSNPTLVYGYGSYGSSTNPYFSSTRLSLLDRGFVYAIVHIRGGQEMGRQWYEDGKLLNKKNTFTDFIDGTEFLVEQGFTSPDHLFAMGGSAGGLLMGAVVNMRPDLYKGIVAGVPFVDVITTMLDESIPLTTFEFDEWGNPKDKEYYDYMLSYSPYDQVEAKDYPHILVTTGLHDSQVQYWEPAKWVAKMRDMKTDNNMLLFYTNMEAGHGGASGRFRELDEVAMEYSFLLTLAERWDD